VDLRQQHSTARAHYSAVRRYLRDNRFTIDGIRDFLSGIEKPNTFNNWLKIFITYGKFVGVKIRFKLRRVSDVVRVLGTKKELHEFYCALEANVERTLFVGYTVTGLMRRELLDVRVDQVNLATEPSMTFTTYTDRGPDYMMRHGPPLRLGSSLRQRLIPFRPPRPGSLNTTSASGSSTRQ